MDSCPVFSQVLPFFLDVLAAQHIELSGDDPVHGFVGVEGAHISLLFFLQNESITPLLHSQCEEPVRHNSTAVDLDADVVVPRFRYSYR